MTHHKNDAVEAMVVLHGVDFERVVVPPLQNMTRAIAADVVFIMLNALNRIIQRAIDKDGTPKHTAEFR